MLPETLIIEFTWINVKVGIIACDVFDTSIEQKIKPVIKYCQKALQVLHAPISIR